jgi:hypothetical protein
MPSLSSFAARPAPRGQFRGSSEGPAIAQERQDRPSKPTTGYFASIISSVPQADVTPLQKKWSPIYSTNSSLMSWTPARW